MSTQISTETMDIAMELTGKFNGPSFEITLAFYASRHRQSARFVLDYIFCLYKIFLVSSRSTCHCLDYFRSNNHCIFIQSGEKPTLAFDAIVF